MRITKLLLAWLLLGTPFASSAALQVFACEPEWSALAGEIGADHVKVHTAITAQQDVHYIQARPSLIAKARRANLLICTGADLEIGWLPLLLRQAANPDIQPGRPGNFMASEYVPMLDVPERLDRSAGDVHPYGNPHIHLDPRNISKIAIPLAERLARLDPDNAVAYLGRAQAFLKRWNSSIQTWQEQARPLRGTTVVVHHNSWVYLENWLEFKIVAALEPKPGIPPSAAHLGRLAQQMATAPARVIVRAPFQSSSASDWLSQRTGIPAVVLPYTVGGTERASDLFGMFDSTIERLLTAVPQ